MPGQLRDATRPRADSAVATSGVAVKRRSPVVPVVAAAVGAGVVAAGVVLVTQGRDGPDPEAVVRDYYSALGDGDCAAVVGLLDTDGRPGEPDRERMVDSCRRAYAEDPARLEGVELEAARLVAHAGDRATVRAELAAPGAAATGEPQEVSLVRIGDDWRIVVGGQDGGADADGGDLQGGDAASGDASP